METAEKEKSAKWSGKNRVVSRCLVYPELLGEMEGLSVNRAAYDAVRTAAGLIRWTQRSAVRISGAEACACLEKLTCADVRSLRPGCAAYSPMLNLQGGVMDDLFLYNEGENRYCLLINEQNRQKDLRHMQRWLQGAELEDIHEQLCLYALLGPAAKNLLNHPPAQDRFSQQTVSGVPCTVLCTDLLGEAGYILLTEAENAQLLQGGLVQAGAAQCDEELLDLLLLEAGLPVYGREMDDTINPLEAGLSRYVRTVRPQYLGREALVAAGEPRRGLKGLRLEEEGAACGMCVIHRDKDVGVVHSTGYSPRLGCWAAVAMLEKPYQDAGRKLRVELPDRLIGAVVEELPLKEKEAEPEERPLEA